MKPIAHARIIPAHLATCVLVLAGASSAVHAAEGFANCTGFIDTLPATITTQGVWCLRKDLATAIASGRAISIATNNVTIDCNDFKLGGLAAGSATLAVGIQASDRSNLIIRRCSLRGFRKGIEITDTGGSHAHVVEFNRLDGNTQYGIHALGDNLMIRNNWVRDTGGAATTLAATGIAAGEGEVVGNIVSGVAPTPGGSAKAWGIVAESGRVEDNRIGGLLPAGEPAAVNEPHAVAISVSGSEPVVVLHNSLSAMGQDNSAGVVCNAPGATTGNVMSGFQWPTLGCNATDNEVLP